MALARKPHIAGNTIRYEVDYSNWLAEGDTLVAAGAVVANVTTAVIDVTISGLDVQSQHLYFFVAGGTEGEVFTVQITVFTSRAEKTIDTIDLFVIAP